MAEQTPEQTDPEEFRGGASEPDEAKGGTGEQAKGMVPDEAQEEGTPPDSSDPQAMDSDALGNFSDSGEDMIDTSAGDNADATSAGHSGGARGSEASLGRHEGAEVDEEDDDKTLDEGD